MIPRAYIIEWQKNTALKNNAQVEQDLVIERALIELFSNEFLKENLAFRGGTAIHKLFLKPQVRYSEDIDLVQIRSTEIGDILSEIRKTLIFIDKKPRFNSSVNSNTIIFRFNSEIEPIQPLRLKVEINCREHFSVYNLKDKLHKIENSWFSGEALIPSYELEELLGTKMRALYQRSKGRDLFDLFFALKNTNLSINKILECYKKYMEFSNERAATSREFINNMEDKIKDGDFIGDIKGLLQPGFKFDIDDAYKLVKQKLLDRI